MDWGLDWDWTEVFLSGGGALGSKNLSLVEEAALVGLVCCFWSWSAAFKLMGDSLETIVTYTSSRLTITRLRGLKGCYLSLLTLGFYVSGTFADVSHYVH